MSEAYVLDTVALVYLAKGEVQKLGREARAIYERFRRAEATLYVPAAALVELWWLEKRSHRFPASMRLWWSRAEEAGFIGISLEPDDVISARDLAWDHTDTNDRLIVATALRLGVPLVTKDETIRDWGGIETVW